jgi:thymidylate kinase
MTEIWAPATPAQGRVTTEKRYPRLTGETAVTEDGCGRILLGVFDLFDRAGIPHCVLHGYADYPRRVKSDVDCIVHSAVTAGEIFRLLHENRVRLSADVVRCADYHFVLAGKNADGSPCLLTLDLTTACEFDGLFFCSGQELLEGRRWHKHFWIPAAHMEFACYLARSIAKGRLDPDRTQRLTTLYREDSRRCETAVARYWPNGSCALIVAAAKSGQWQELRPQLGRLQSELRRKVLLQSPGRFIAHLWRRLASVGRRFFNPDGLSVVFLGPDGAGKSSMIDVVSGRLHAAFDSFATAGFAPALHRVFDRRQYPTDRPHALQQRSLPISLLRAGFWFVFYLCNHFTLYLAKARPTLVLYDRHFFDIFVDPKRYRYGGPAWILRVLARVIPKPDVVILLDASPEILQSRKQEVAFEVSAQQRKAYLSLLPSLPNYYLVDASGPLQRVASDVSEIILRRLAARVAGRRGVD